jgi:hypothetical protein
MKQRFFTAAAIAALFLSADVCAQFAPIAPLHTRPHPTKDL